MDGRQAAGEIAVRAVDREPLATTDREVAPLAHDGWLEWTATKHRVRPHRLGTTHPDGSGLQALVYLDRREIVLPPLHPYVPLGWSAPTTEKRYRQSRRWLEDARPVVEEMRARGLATPLVFEGTHDGAPVDMRPWQWAGFRVGVRYTYWRSLPVDAAEIDPAVRRKARQATEHGYHCERAVEPDEVVACLVETERRQGFGYGLTVADVARLRDLLGPERFRMYVCRAPDDTVAAVRLVLHARGHVAIDWVNGTASDHLQSGATQLLIGTVLDDVARAGASAFDFEGANIPGVAAAKMTWGAQLVPWYVVEPFGLRGLARWGRDWLRYVRGVR